MTDGTKVTRPLFRYYVAPATNLSAAAGGCDHHLTVY